MNVLLGPSDKFWATYRPKTPYGVYGGEWINTIEMVADVKMKLSITSSQKKRIQLYAFPPTKCLAIRQCAHVYVMLSLT